MALGLLVREVPGQALPRRDQPYGERRAGRPRRRGSPAGRSPSSQASSSGSISACSASIASSVSRSSVVGRARAAAARGPASSPAWWWCSALGEELPALGEQPARRLRSLTGVRRAAAAKRGQVTPEGVVHHVHHLHVHRALRCRGLARQPELRRASRGVGVVLMVVLLSQWCAGGLVTRRPACGSGVERRRARRSVTSTRTRAGRGRARRASTSSSGRASSSWPARGPSGPAVASRVIATAMPTPSCLTTTSTSLAKPRKTATMIAAAAEITRPVDGEAA